MKTEFDNLKLNNNHSYESDSNGDKQVVKIYCDGLLIAKKVQHKKSLRYFGVNDYQQTKPKLVEVLPQQNWTINNWIVTHRDLHRTEKIQSFLAILKEKDYLIQVQRILEA